MSRLSPRALEYLNAIARFGSLRKAAAKLNVDPAAISRLMALLEEEVGLPLWERNHQSSRITMAGAELLDHYRQVQASEMATLSRIQDLRGLRKGEVKVVVGEGFVSELIAAPLQDFISRYPSISINIEIAGANEAVQLIKDDQVDFGIVYACPEARDLRCHVERIHPLDLIAPPDHPLVALNRPVEFQDISQYPLALIDNAFGMGRLIRLVEEIEHISLTPNLRTNSVAVLKHFVTSGLGVTFMPQLSIAEEIGAKSIYPIKIKHRLFSEARIKVVSHNRRDLTLPADALLRHLITSMRSLREDAPAINI